LYLNDQEIEYTNTEKLLGMYLDNIFKWKTQIQSTKEKCNSQLYFLKPLTSRW
jgi:hypothetical protein